MIFIPFIAYIISHNPLFNISLHQKPTVPDYLEMFELLVNNDSKSSCLAAYISEAAVLFPCFGR